jgi:hypothetical protein
MTAVITRVVLFICFCFSLFSATSYTIQPLVDSSQPGTNFLIGPPGFNITPVNNTPYLGGIVTPTGSPAIGTLSGNTFSLLSLSPLVGGSQPYVSTTLKDGSAVGFTNFSLPNPINPSFPPSVVPRITRWENGVASEITIADPNNANAVFPPYPIAFNSEGDIVGQHIANGVVSAFRYNLFDQSFTVIPLPFSDVSQLVVTSINEQGKILAIPNRAFPGPPAGQILYDPATKSWKEIPFPSGMGLNGDQYLNSSGQFASVYLDFATFSNKLYLFNGTENLPLYNGPGPFLNTERVFGLNRHGQAIGNLASRLGIFSGGAFDELFPLITNSSGWRPFDAFQHALVGINDNGQIFGIGEYNNAITSFVLNPTASPEVPEPGTVLLTLSAFSLLFIRHRQS